MADQTIQATEEMVGANHATKDDTLNRLTLVEHNADGTHKESISVAGYIRFLPFEPTPTQLTTFRLLHMDGSSLLRATYADLFGIIGVTFGNVDGTHFNLPDVRGRFPRFWADGQTTDPDRVSRTDRGDGTSGDEVGTLQDHEIESHTHQNLRGHQSTGVRDAASNYITTWSITNSSYVTIGANGGNETRPLNINFWGGIHY